MPCKKKGLLSSLIKQGHLDASLIMDKLELSAGLEEPNYLLVSVIHAGHPGADPIGVNVEGSVSVGSIAGPVRVATKEIYLVGEQGLAYVFSLVLGVLDEEGKAEEGVVSRGLRRSLGSFGVVLVGETQLQGQDQKESYAQCLHHIFKYYPPGLQGI